MSMHENSGTSILPGLGQKRKSSMILICSDPAKMGTGGKFIEEKKKATADFTQI